MDFRYAPLPTAERVHADPHEVIAIVGPWGSGKSTIAAVDLFNHCVQYRCDALIVRDTYPALRDSCVKKWMELFRGAGDLHMGPPPTFKWSGKLRGQEVLFRSAELPEDIQKFGSVEVGYAWLEEVCPGLLPGGAVNVGMQAEVLAGVIGRVRKWGAGGDHRRIVLSSLPPPTTRHWFHRLFYDRQPALGGAAQGFTEKPLAETVAIYHLDPAENLKNLPADYYALQAAFLTSQDQVDRFLLGKVGAGYGRSAVYGEQWNDQDHIREVEPSAGPMILGIDGGLDASAVWLQIQPSGRLFVLAELCTHGLGLEDFGLYAIQQGNRLFGPRTYEVWSDPALFARSQNDGRDGAWYLGHSGLRPRAAPQDPTLRIGSVRTWLSRAGAQGRLVQVHPRCEMLIEGFRGAYHFRMIGGEVSTTVDKNEFSHPHDALQYPCAALLHRGDLQQKLPPIVQPDALGRMFPLRITGTPRGLSLHSRHARADKE